MKRVLLINHYAGSPKMGMEYRPWLMAKRWRAMGFTVTIIAATNSHVRSVQPKIEKTMDCENIEGVDYVWIKTSAYSGNGIARLKNILMFVGKLLYFSKKIATLFKPDVVIASSTYPLDIYPAKKIANFVDARLLFEVHDLWPLSPIELGGMSRFNPFIVLCQLAENYAYKNSEMGKQSRITLFQNNFGRSTYSNRR